MGQWSKSKALPANINGNQEFTTEDNLTVDELNAIVNNSFYASDVADNAIGKAQEALDAVVLGEGTKVTIDGIPQSTWSADFVESEKSKSGNDNPILHKNDVDNSLSLISTNPIQNKVLYNPVTFAESERQKSKNLLSVRNVDGSSFITIGEDGLITFKGNVEAVPYHIFKGKIYLKKGHTYTLSIQNYSGSGKNLVTFGAEKVSDGSWLGDYLYTYGFNNSITPTEDVILVDCKFYWAIDTPVDFSCYLQLEEGEVVTDYQPYCGAIVHEEEIADVEHIELIYNKNTKNTIGVTAYTSGLPIYNGVEYPLENLSKYNALEIMYQPSASTHDEDPSFRTCKLDLKTATVYGYYTTYDCVKPCNVKSHGDVNYELFAMFNVDASKTKLYLYATIVDYLGNKTSIDNADFVPNYKIIQIKGVY